MGSFAADHLVRRPGRVRRPRSAAAVAGAAAGLLMTVGITPDPPRDRLRLPAVRRALGDGGGASGDRVQGEAVRDGGARRTCDSGRYLWNASMFVWRVEVFLGELAAAAAGAHDGLAAIADAWGTPEQDRVLGEVWPTLPKISVDHAVMEGAAAAGLVGDRAGRLRLDRRRRLRHAGRGARRPTARAPTPAGNVVVADADAVPVVLLRDRRLGGGGRTRAGWSPPSGCATSSWWTPRTRCWSATASRAQEIKTIVDELKSRGDAPATCERRAATRQRGATSDRWPSRAGAAARPGRTSPARATRR